LRAPAISDPAIFAGHSGRRKGAAAMARPTTEQAMTANIDDLLPNAESFRTQLALAEAKKASAEMHRQEEEEAHKRALIEHLSRPSGISEEEAVRRGVEIIRRATAAGLTEVQVYRFPNELCTDRGRSINQNEPGWEETLTGIPRELYLLWHKHFRPRGYKLRVQILEFPDGMPGDIGMTLSWL
jgi:hypothetical protein